MKKKQMDRERKKLIVGTLGIVAVAVLIVANLVFAYAQKQQRISDAQRPLLTQQELDAARSSAEAERNGEAEKFDMDIFSVAPLPAPTPKTTLRLPEPTPEPTQKPTPQPPERTLPPTATTAPTPTPKLQPPMPESTAVPPPVMPTPAPQTTPTHKDGDKRVNAQGEKEVYMSGIGWLPDSPGGTYEPIQ